MPPIIRRRVICSAIKQGRLIKALDLLLRAII